MSSSSSIPAPVLAHYADFRSAHVRPLGTGLINQTFLAESTEGMCAVFQRLHSIFSGTVNTDLENVALHLAAKGLVTPHLIRTDQGARFVEDVEGGIWRALTYVEGECIDRLTSTAQARTAGALVARFHAALTDFSQDFAHRREGAHDMNRHVATLCRALDEHRSHRLREEVALLAESFIEAAATLPDLSHAPQRVCHGDLKISNLMFQEGEGVCLIDLDTLGLQIWPFEMGDALRSWCSSAREDALDAKLCVDFFEAAVDGYGRVLQGSGFPSKEEWALLVEGLASICLELSIRFLADALNESYFAFDPKRFPASGEHNLLRAHGQWALFQDVEKKRLALEEIVQRQQK